MNSTINLIKRVDINIKRKCYNLKLIGNGGINKGKNCSVDKTRYVKKLRTSGSNWLQKNQESGTKQEI